MHGQQPAVGPWRWSVVGKEDAMSYDPTCHGSVGKSLDSAVMTTWAESSISHGLICLVILGH
jgi:hypothetical protein